MASMKLERGPGGYSITLSDIKTPEMLKSLLKTASECLDVKYCEGMPIVAERRGGKDSDE